MRIKYLFIAVLGFITMFGCEKNNTPEIIEVEVSPKKVTGGIIFTLTAKTLDADLDPLSYLWTCDDGEFIEGSTTYKTKWYAPSTLPANIYSIKVSVFDGEDSVSLTTQIDLTTPVPFTFTDNRDGKRYLACRIGIQTWMIENLAYLPVVSPSSIGSDYASYYYVYEYEETSTLSAMATDNYGHYGVLYNWDAAKTACPTGWHLPSDQDWKTLENYFGMSSSDDGASSSGDVGFALKSTSGWYDDANGDNSSGFNALPGGIRTNGNGFDLLGYYTFFWSNKPFGTTDAYYYILGYDTGELWEAVDLRRFGLSVRCLQDR